MRAIRQFLCWFFAFNAVIPIFLMVAILFPRRQAEYNWHGGSHFVGTLLYYLLLSPFATVFGMAWWTVLMEKKWARGCAIAASIVLLLPFSLPLIVHSATAWGAGLVFPVAGILGLVAFSRDSTLSEIHEASED